MKHLISLDDALKESVDEKNYAVANLWKCIKISINNSKKYDIQWHIFCLISICSSFL